MSWRGRLLCWLGYHRPDHPDNFYANCTRCDCEMIWYSEWLGGEFGHWERKRTDEEIAKKWTDETNSPPMPGNHQTGEETTMPEEAKGDDPKMTDILEVKLTFVGSRNEVFPHKVRKRMPKLGHATEVACTELRDIVQRRLGTGAGRRFSLVSASKILNNEEKLALLAEHKADKEKSS